MMNYNNLTISNEQLLCILRQTISCLEKRECEKVSFEQAVEASIIARKGRRARTLAEIRGVCMRLMRCAPGLARMSVQSMGRAECSRLISMAETPRQQHKIRVILHGVFEYCRRQEWCLVNPVSSLAPPVLQEHEIVPLSWDSIRRLLRIVRLRRYRPCMAALGLMLWAGVRPIEVTRLSWADIDWEESVVAMRPVHSKTGGIRHIEMRPVLRRWLCESGVGEGDICPPNWERRWRSVRKAAGLIPWQQDVLRHTFASYHAKHFHDFLRLQEDMGHRSAALLRTRYLSMRGVTAAHAALFWKPGAL